MRRVLALVVLFLVVGSVQTLPAQGEKGEPERLGKVHFPVSCTSLAQQQFDRAVAMMHSFWYAPAANAFTEAAKTDPNCAMAYWGMAMTWRGTAIVSTPDAAALKQGQEAIEKAKMIGGKTQRERDYVAATESYYKDWEKLDHRTRVLAYENSMEQLYSRYPEDSEAAIFYALALDEAAAVLPADKDFTRQLKAAAILEKVLATQPEHPGALHYLIHSYDFPPLAQRGVVAAQRYGEVAPSAPHALHMPSHIYSMLGMWQDSIKSNQAALSVSPGYAHALDFMVYAYLQGAQDSEAKRAVERCIELRKNKPATGPAFLPYSTGVAAIPARYAIERGAWAEAASLEPTHITPVADAITYFARAMGSIRSGALGNARKDIEQLRQIGNELIQSKQDYWAHQGEIQRLAATAWVTFTEGKKEEALKLMRSAADQEDASQKDVSMENRLWPMRELLGELLLAMNEPKQALEQFELSLESARNRYRGFYGAAKAAQWANNSQKARDYFEKLAAICSHSDNERPELVEARKYLAEK